MTTAELATIDAVDELLLSESLLLGTMRKRPRELREIRKTCDQLLDRRLELMGVPDASAG